MNVGIDLGTTNSALAYINPAEADEADFPPIHTLEIPQTVSPGLVEPRKTLPSFLNVAEEPVAGVYAREQSALVPTKSVHSAKSWLSNPDVDRTARILPWDAQESGRILSPVEVSALFLRHIRDAWEKSGRPPINEQNVVVTVPASFDEEARELTVQAAAEAGIEKLTLLEEPAAAFYSWIANHLTQSQKHLVDGMMVLVCDVGGGTSDFTLIRVNREGDRVEFTRTAVGKHLLLGGDNLDLTLTWLVEAKLGTTLSLRQRSALRRQCAAAKERLLTDPKLERVEITVLGAGSGLVGGTLKTDITRAEALELALDGFLPFTDLNEKPKEEKRSVFRELGLPYVSDPAITRHLAAFLSTTSTKPDAILFNGGFFIPEVVRTRVADVLERWYGARPLLLENQDLDLAVAIGGAYYSYVRSTGAGLIVRGGLPRSYYIGIRSDGGELQTVCLAPRGAEEGDTVEVDREDLQLVANKPVSFRLYSSLSRADDKVGDHVTFTPEQTEELHLHAPLNAVIRFGRKAEERTIPVKLGARLTEVGTLEIWADSRVSEHRWKLQFELRKAVQTTERTRPAAVISEEGLVQARKLMEDCFRANTVEPHELPAKLEQALALGRNSWPLSAIRQMSDWLFELAEGRGRSPAHEVRWLNLTGWCLRPGFGFPGDDFRIEQARKIYAAGPRFPNQVENETQWWIFCGRIAGGMNRNQQTDIFQRLSPNLLPKGQKKPPRLNSSLVREMWRTAASLELLPLQTKADLGETLVKRLKNGEGGPSELWCVGRLGSRKLFYGPNNLVVSPTVAGRWVDALIKIQGSEEALASISQMTGDSTRDLPPAAVNLVRARLKNTPALLNVLEGEERDEGAMGRVFGEELPTGLVFANV